MPLPAPLQQVDRTFVKWNGRKLSYFAGCDYFRLASHPQVLHAAEKALTTIGLNVSASRKTTGNHTIYDQLEATLKNFFGSASAVLVPNGYATNVIAAQGLAGDFTHAVLDERAHPSLKDAAKFLGAEILSFEHRDPQSLAQRVKSIGKSARVVLLTDGMFSHDGSIAPLGAYLKALPRSATIVLDDAHAAGTLGLTGKGSLEAENIPRDRVVQTITLSKAFGAYGGAILCDDALRDRIISNSGMFVGSTPLPLPMAAAAIKGVQLLATHPRWRKQLIFNVTFVKSALKKSGITVTENTSPIITVVPSSESHAETLKAQCLHHKIFPSLIKYPGGPETGFFRFVISSEHKAAQLEALVCAIISSAPTSASL